MLASLQAMADKAGPQVDSFTGETYTDPEVAIYASEVDELIKQFNGFLQEGLPDINLESLLKHAKNPITRNANPFDIALQLWQKRYGTDESLRAKFDEKLYAIDLRLNAMGLTMLDLVNHQLKLKNEFEFEAQKPQLPDRFRNNRFAISPHGRMMGRSYDTEETPHNGRMPVPKAEAKSIIVEKPQDQNVSPKGSRYPQLSASPTNIRNLHGEATETRALRLESRALNLLRHNNIKDLKELGNMTRQEFVRLLDITPKAQSLIVIDTWMNKYGISFKDEKEG